MKKIIHDINYYRQYEPYWGEWRIEELIGEGSYGQVYRISKDGDRGKEDAALKAISVPHDEGELNEAVTSFGPDGASVYFRDMAERFTGEIDLLRGVRASKNIVNYESSEVFQSPDGLQWDIFIRMELLEGLNDYLRRQQGGRMGVVQILHLGIDLCAALAVCEEKDIIHRDIKPANIFIDRQGNFKLGDFGVARVASQTRGASTKAGTYDYMAPEVYAGRARYDQTVDIYSTGLVLYRLLNNNRFPFTPQGNTPVTYQEAEEARAKRLKGSEPLPAPAGADRELSRIILRACAFVPEDRYQTAEDFGRDLIRYLDERRKERVPGKGSPIPPVSPDKDGEDSGTTVGPGERIHPSGTDESPADGTGRSSRSEGSGGSDGSGGRDGRGTATSGERPEKDHEGHPEDHAEDLSRGAPAEERHAAGKRRAVAVAIVLSAFAGIVLCILAVRIMQRDNAVSDTDGAVLETGSPVILPGDDTYVRYSYGGETKTHASDLVYTSSDEDVASIPYDVSARQTVIRGISPGTAVITGTENGISGTTTIYVAANDREAGNYVAAGTDSMTLSNSGVVTIPLEIGEDLPDGYEITAYLSPELDNVIQVQAEADGDSGTLTLTGREDAGKITAKGYQGIGIGLEIGDNVTQYSDSVSGYCTVLLYEMEDGEAHALADSSTHVTVRIGD